MLRQQYCEKRFHKYSEFISCLFVAEQNNEVFNEKSRDPPNWFCSISISECNNISYSYFHGNSYDLGRGHASEWLWT